MAIYRTFQTAKFVIGPFSTAFFEAIACNTPYYCYVPSKLKGVPPLTSDSPFVFSDIHKIREVLNNDYPLQYLRETYLTDQTASIDKIITGMVRN